MINIINNKNNNIIINNRLKYKKKEIKRKLNKF